MAMILTATMKTVIMLRPGPKRKGKAKRDKKWYVNVGLQHTYGPPITSLYHKRLCDAPTLPHKDDTSPPLSDDNLSFAGDNSSDEGSVP